MEKHLWINQADDQLADNHPGCMWGIFHALDYHHWQHNVKKILPHKKHDGGRHAKRNKNPKTRLGTHHSGESNFPVNQSTTESISINKKSLKARIKALVADEICKEENHKQRGSGFPARPRLQRTFSIHHLEPSDHGLDRTKWSHPIIFLPKNADTSAKRFQDLAHMKAIDKLVASNQKFDGCGTENVKDYVDILELFKVNKDLFHKILQNTDDGIGNFFNNVQGSNAKAKLTKSGSFPMADFSRSRNSRHSKLKYKQNEFQSFPKGEKLLADTQAPKLVTSKFSNDLCTKSERLMADDTRFSSLSSTNEPDDQGSNEVVEPLEDSRKKIDLAINEGKKESILGGDDNDSHETGGSVQDLSKATLTHFRRTSSLDESLNRYARLFEYGFSRKAKWNLSKSLKLTNEYEIPSGGPAPTSFRRIRSLSHLDLFNCLQNEESHDSHFPGMQISNTVDSCRNNASDSQDEPNPVGHSMSTEEYVQLDSNEETECLSSMVEKGDISPRGEYSVSFKVGINDNVTATLDDLREEMNELTARNSNSHKELAKTSTYIASNKLPQPSPVSVLQSCLHEVTSNAEFHFLEGLDSLNCSDTDFVPESCSTMYPENFENAKKSVKNHRRSNLHMKENADFNYVREILEVSGFSGNGFNETWHSSDQPLDPSIFEELETCWPHELECYGEGINACRRELLFDLVNEVLIQIYERSFTYYPRALSSTCHVPPMPVGDHVLEEVWESISKPELEQSLDFVVGRDLSKDDRWMNLQMESECVALELEDLIFDDLLEEVVRSRDH